jgi:hypothetical protein
MPRAGRLVVTVTGLDGRPAAGAVLDLKDPGGGFVVASIFQLMGLAADPKGVIQLVDVAPGRYRVVALADGAASEPVVVEVRAGEETRLAVEIRPR